MLIVVTHEHSPELRPSDDLLVQRCRFCRTHFLYQQAVCPFCLSEHLEWVSRSPNWAGVICRVNAARRAGRPLTYGARR